MARTGILTHNAARRPAVPAPVFEARDLGVQLGGRAVLDGVSFSVRPGERIALVGPNGSGKTTLLRAMAGLLPHTGALALDGESVVARIDRQPRVGALRRAEPGMRVPARLSFP